MKQSKRAFSSIGVEEEKVWLKGEKKPYQGFSLEDAESAIAASEKLTLDVLHARPLTAIDSFVCNWVFKMTHVSLHRAMKALEHISQSHQGYDHDKLSLIWEKGRELHGQFSEWLKQRNKNCHCHIFCEGGGDCYCFCDDMEKEAHWGIPYFFKIAFLERDLILLRQGANGATNKQMPQPTPPIHSHGVQYKDDK